jgi:hypothetical protein
MILPIDIVENVILKHVNLIDIWNFSITCKLNIYLFKSEVLWQLKCNQVDKTCLSWFEQVVGKRVPLINNGDCIRYIYVNEKAVFPTIPKRIAFINSKDRVIKACYHNVLYHFKSEGYRLPSDEIINKGVIVTYEYPNVENLENEVHTILYSRHGTPPIYGYAIDHIRIYEPKTTFTIIENITVPISKALRDIQRKTQVLD